MKREIASSTHGLLNRAGWSFTHMADWSGPSDTFDHTQYCIEEPRDVHIPGHAVVVLIDLATDEFKVYAASVNPGYSGRNVKKPPKPAHTPLAGKMRAGLGARALANDIRKELDFMMGVFRVSGLEGLS